MTPVAGPARLCSWIARSPAAIAPLLLIAIAERVSWTLAGHMETLDTELRNAAISWAQTGHVADAFAVGSGLTAHVGALPPIIPGTIFWLFGADSGAAALILTALSAAVIVATAFVLNRVFARLGTPAALRGAALVVICLLPLHIEIESRSLRVYENGMAALGLALVLLAVLRCDDRARVGVIDMIGLSALVALLVALSPVTGYAAIALLGLLALRQLDGRGRFTAATILCVILFATTLPWALRNREAVGAMIWTRGNFGLEFALGTHAAAVAPADPGAVYLARLAEIHPHQHAKPYRAMQMAGGELAYADALGAATWRWVAAHPADALSIWARHWTEFFFPPAWLWLHSAERGVTLPIRIVLVDVIAALALAGLATGLVRRQRGLTYLIAPVILLPLPYLLSQPLVRYRYVIASLLVFLAADAFARLTRRGQAALRSPP